MAAAAAVRSAGLTSLGHEQVMAALDALDAADQAATPEQGHAIPPSHSIVLQAAAEAEQALSTVRGGQIR